MIPLQELGDLVAAGDGRFIFSSYQPGAAPQILSVDGVVTVQALSSEPSPLLAGEVLVEMPGSGLRVVGLAGVDVEAGTMHPVPTPESGFIHEVRAVGQSLTAVLYDDGGVWISEDGAFASNDQEGEAEYVDAAFIRADGRLVLVLTSGERAGNGRTWQVSVRESLDDGGTGHGPVQHGRSGVGVGPD